VQTVTNESTKTRSRRPKPWGPLNPCWVPNQIWVTPIFRTPNSQRGQGPPVLVDATIEKQPWGIFVGPQPKQCHDGHQCTFSMHTAQGKRADNRPLQLRLESSSYKSPFHISTQLLTLCDHRCRVERLEKFDIHEVSSARNS
jgi:hypothetical protein